MAFKFKFEAILNLKVRMEDMKKAELRRISKELEDEKEKLKNLMQEREVLYEKVREKSSRGITKQELITFNNYVSVLKRKITNQKSVIFEISTRLDKVRQELVKVSQEKKMFEILKEKKYDEYMKEYYKKEQEVVDNLISFRFSGGEIDDPS
ncbi:MAG: flagellar export protein FliJ [Clostridia bacterium]|nr:flagellar export protein FliJ [Clostridia bacterium]